MGRPLNKRFFGSDAASNIKIQFNNGTSSVPGFIVKQKGTRSFLCSSATGEQAVCSLVAKDSASLLPGEMSMTVKLDSGVVEHVTKITAHRISSPSGEYAWNFSTSTTDNAAQIEEAGQLVEPVPPTPEDPTDNTIVDAVDLEGDDSAE